MIRKFFFMISDEWLFFDGIQIFVNFWMEFDYLGDFDFSINNRIVEIPLFGCDQFSIV